MGNRLPRPRRARQIRGVESASQDCHWTHAGSARRRRNDSGVTRLRDAVLWRRGNGEKPHAAGNRQRLESCRSQFLRRRAATPASPRFEKEFCRHPIQFQDRIIVVKGKGLEPLCDALERLAVERIRIRPEKYDNVAKNEGIINEIEISLVPSVTGVSPHRRSEEADTHLA